MIGGGDQSGLYGSSAHGWDGEVEYYSQLPDPATVSGDIYHVLEDEGVWLLGTKKVSGLWESNGITWDYLGVEAIQVTEIEKTEGTLEAIRRFSPKDITDMIGDHADINVQSDWNQADDTQDDYIKNKPITITIQQVTDIEANNLKNNYPLADASKLAGIEAGAQVNVNADWTASGTDAEIFNKPTTISAQQATDISSNNAKISFPEAPQDGKEYIRKDAEWAELTTGQSVYGSELEIFESLSESNTTSSVMQSKIDATTQIKPSGKYMIRFSCEIANT